ncbi:epoxyqueuosine reductase QueH [Treponema sp. OMZ 840]|uniref:epoxyqueuosine reductase QueH n=1 Tax=Treponema sp. OMZ 840 TaxID=244313 RepID=UPI003D8FF6C8
MNEQQNFDKLFSLELERIERSPDFPEQKPRLLLHACCGPCSSAVLERLTDFFDISIFYYNPNIHPAAEYERRLEELGFFLEKRYGIAAGNTENGRCDNADNDGSTDKKSRPSLIRADYIPDDFFTAVNTKEFPERAFEAEQGERCSLCYRLRMEKAAVYAIKNGFDYFTTTLSISPHKDAAKINAIGLALENELNAPLRYLYADFKKRNGYKRSLEISAEYGLYRQDYCGCIYSKQNTEKRRGQKKP